MYGLSFSLVLGSQVAIINNIDVEYALGHH